MLKKAAVGLVAALLATAAFAQADRIPAGIPHLDHVFVIMMENHGYQQVIDNPNEPYLNSLIANRQVNLATNYYAVGHPSLTNYLEVVGGSNFGVINDDSPDWHNTSCTPNIVSGIPADESAATNTCPITGSGWDAPTPAVDTTNEGTPEE